MIENFFRVFWMSHVIFVDPLRMIALLTIKKRKPIQPITPSEGLCITLRYFVTGYIFVTIGASYWMSPAVISQIIPKPWNATWEVFLKNNYIEEPTNEAGWCNVAEGFDKKVNFPKTVDVTDRKHILVPVLRRSWPAYFNY